MIKEHIRKTLYKFLELDEFYKLKDAIVQSDISNQEGLEFCLDNIKVKNNFFDKYKWDKYLDLPWYIRRLFNNKYGIIYRHSDFYDSDDLYINDTWIADGRYPIGKILEKINLYKKRKGKK